MADRYTRSLLSVIAIASTLILTACSNPDTSGGVTLAKGADDGNEFPHGSCKGPGENPPTYDQGCGWISVYEGSYYIMPRAELNSAVLFNADLTAANLGFANLNHANLTGANLTGANLTGASLFYANLSDANLSGAKLISAKLTNANLSGADLRVRA